MPDFRENNKITKSSPIFIIDEEILDSKLYLPILAILQHQVANQNAGEVFSDSFPQLYVISSQQSTHVNLNKIKNLGIVVQTRDIVSLQSSHFEGVPTLNRDNPIYRKIVLISVIQNELKNRALKSSIYYFYCNKEILKIYAEMPSKKDSFYKDWYLDVMLNFIYLNELSADKELIRMGYLVGLEQFVGPLLDNISDKFHKALIENHSYLMATKKGSPDDCRPNNNSSKLIESLANSLILNSHRYINDLIITFIKKYNSLSGSLDLDKEDIFNRPVLPTGIELVKSQLQQLESLVGVMDILESLQKIKEIVEPRKDQPIKSNSNYYTESQIKLERELYQDIFLLIEELLSLNVVRHNPKSEVTSMIPRVNSF